MKALFRGARVYENGTMKQLDMYYNGESLSIFEGDVSLFPSTSIFDNRRCAKYRLKYLFYSSFT